MVGFTKRFARDKRGAQAVEIALGIVLIALVAGLGMATLGNQLGVFFKDVGTDIATNAPDPNPNLNGLP